MSPTNIPALANIRISFMLLLISLSLMYGIEGAYPFPFKLWKKFILPGVKGDAIVVFGCSGG